MADFIFHDPSGRRDRQARLSAGLLVSLAALVVAGFFATLAFAPRLPSLSLKDPRVLQALHVETVHRLAGRPAWTHVPRRPNAGKPGGATRPLTVGFYDPTDSSSQESLAKHVGQLDVFAPQWIFLNGSQGLISITPDPQTEAIVASAKNAPSVLPLVHNFHDTLADGPLADNLLVNPAARAQLVSNLVAAANTHGYGGYIFDLENLSPAGLAAYPSLLAEARAALKPTGREVWVAAPFADDDFNLKKFQAVTDTVVLMAYDENYSGGQPGPIASQDWFQQNLAKDAAQLDPTFAYDDDGQKHVVWFLDAATVFNEVKAADAYRPRAYAVWYMGAEDPALWAFFHLPYGTVQPTDLETIAPSTTVDFDGDGEILKVSSL